MEENIVIGIEGLVGAGKTTMARKLLEYIPNSIIIHGGNIYRAIAFSLLKSGKKVEEAKDLNAFDLFKKFNLNIKVEDRQTVMYCNDEKILEEDLQSINTSLAVSKISQMADNKMLYDFGKSIIDKFKEEYNIILSSRDIMKMYPNTDYHFFITATLEERTRRKCIQYIEKLDGEDKKRLEAQIRENIEKRDKLQEEAGYYKIYDNTIVIDVTKDKNPQESVEKILKYIK